jgi:tripartite-type tricarboxylate transporter receptor subunit TctC
MDVRHALQAACAAAMLCVMQQPLLAQDYPSKPLRMVIPWPPGGVTDTVARVMSATISESVGRPIVPENRPGAAGTLGVAVVAKANPDGYTLMMTDVPSLAISATLYPNLPYDTMRDIEPVALPARSPLVLVTQPKLGVTTIPGLIERVKAAPGKTSFASSGPGSITHLAAERFVRDTGARMLHIPYKGGGPATVAVVGGEADIYFSCISAAVPHIKAGRLVLLGITAPRRSPLFPDAPAVNEAIPGFDMGCNTGFFTTGGTPDAIVARIYAEVMKAVATQRLRDVLVANLAEAAPYSRAQFREHIAAEIRDWGAVVRDAKLKVE